MTEISDKDKIANLILENRMLENKAIILAKLALGASKVLDYYASTNMALPAFNIAQPDPGQPLYNKSRYRIIEVLDNCPDKESLIGMEIYDVNIDTETARKASEQIINTFKELDILIEDRTLEKSEKDEPGEQLSLDIEIKETTPPEEEDNGQLHIDFSKGEINEN